MITFDLCTPYPSKRDLDPVFKAGVGVVDRDGLTIGTIKKVQVEIDTTYNKKVYIINIDNTKTLNKKTIKLDAIIEIWQNGMKPIKEGKDGELDLQ